MRSIRSIISQFRGIRQPWKWTLLLWLILPVSVYTQSIGDLESELKSAVGYERLDILQQLTEKYTELGDRKAIKYGKQTVALADNLFEDNIADERWIKSYSLLAKAYYTRDKFYSAQENFIAVKSLGNPQLHKPWVDEADTYLSKMDSIIFYDGKLPDNFLSKTLDEIHIGEVFNNATSSVVINSHINQAERMINKGEIDRGIELLEKAAFEIEKKGEMSRLKEVYEDLGLAYKQIGNDKKSEEYKGRANDIHIQPDSLKVNIAKSMEMVGKSDSILKALQPKGYMLSPDEDRSIQPLQKTATRSTVSSSIENLEGRKDDLEEFARQAESKSDYKTLAALKDEIAQLQLETKELEIKEKELELLKLSSKNAQLSYAREREAQQSQLKQAASIRRGLIGGTIALFVFFMSVGYMYFGKRKEHKKLSVAYHRLDDTKNELSLAQQKIKTLLGQQVSGDVAEALLATNPDEPSDKKFVCVMFLDIRDFTAYVEKLEPEQIIQYQNDIFGIMINIINEHKGNINQFMGDGFMATFGAPYSHGNDCQNAYNAAIQIIETIRTESAKGTIPETKLGIGLHAGYVVSGNVGTDLRKQYSITGNAVIISSRLEQLNKKFNSQLVLSQTVFEKLKDQPDHNFKSVRVKGREEPLNVIAIG